MGGGARQSTSCRRTRSAVAVVHGSPPPRGAGGDIPRTVRINSISDVIRRSEQWTGCTPCVSPGSRSSAASRAADSSSSLARGERAGCLPRRARRAALHRTAARSPDRRRPRLPDAAPASSPTSKPSDGGPRALPRGRLRVDMPMALARQFQCRRYRSCSSATELPLEVRLENRAIDLVEGVDCAICTASRATPISCASARRIVTCAAPAWLARTVFCGPRRPRAAQRGRLPGARHGASRRLGVRAPRPATPGPPATGLQLDGSLRQGRPPTWASQVLSRSRMARSSPGGAGARRLGRPPALTSSTRRTAQSARIARSPGSPPRCSPLTDAG